jgi:hypothetical protein
MIEHCGGRRQRRPRPDLGCSAIGWADGKVQERSYATRP